MTDEKKNTTPEEENKQEAEPKAEKKQSVSAKEAKTDQKADTKKSEKQKAVAKDKPAGAASEATPEEIEAGKGLAAISYISILFLIPMISMRDNRFAIYHAKQSMVLVLSAMISWLVLFLVGMVTSWLGIGILLIGLSYVILFAWLVLMIIGFVKAFSGEYWRIPLIADWADKIKI